MNTVVITDRNAYKKCQNTTLGNDTRNHTNVIKDL